jgi:MFS transporter, FSR family, fosmidomycin resistance protein
MRAATGVAWSSLAALAAGHFAVDCCTGIWPVYKTLAQLDLSKAGLIAMAGSMTGNGLQLAFGLLADRGWRKRLLVAGLALSGTVTFLPWTRSYLLMFALVLVTYVGAGAFHPAGTGAAAALSRSRTGMVVGVFLAGGYAGYALSQLLFSAAYEWSATFTPLLLIIPLGAAVAVALRVPPLVAARPRGHGMRAALAPHRALLSALFLVQVFTTAVNLAVIFLLPDLMMARGAPAWMVRGGAHSALVLGGCLSLLPAGHAADRWGARRVLLAANATTGVLLAVFLLRSSASALDLVIVAAFGAFSGMNNVVVVSEGNRTLPGETSAISALMMGLPWCFAAGSAALAGVLADAAHGGTPARALAWLALAIPMALIASACVRSPRDAVAS